MSAYQMAVRSTAGLTRRVDVGALYEGFLDWWVGLYIAPRKPRPMI